MKKTILGALAALLAFTAMPLPDAQAQSVRVVIGDRDRDRDRDCTVRRVRTVKNGRVTYRTVRRCEPDREVCTVRKQRVFSNGRYITRTVRRCR